VDHRRDWEQLLAGADDGNAAQPERICRLCVSLLGVTGAGISIVTAAGNHGVVCSTDAVSARIEDLQFTLGEGPCVDALAAASPVLVPDLDDSAWVLSGRWPTFLSAAVEAGVRAVFAFPLTIGAIHLGAIDLYRDAPGELTDNELAGALLAAHTATIALLHLKDSSNVPGGDTRMPTSNEIQIHRATGMVQVQLGCTPEEALLRIRGRAFGDGRTVTDVATDVVTRQLSFSGDGND
jgi:hypothetical protein